MTVMSGAAHEVEQTGRQMMLPETAKIISWEMILTGFIAIS